MASIELEDICLDYRMYDIRERSLRGLAANTLIGGLHSQNGKITRALNQVSLSFKDGDRVALIGPNGAGKSTLLRLLAGVYKPTEGVRDVSGSIGTLFDIYHGMDDDLTGTKFVINHGLFRGASKAQLYEMLPAIREFSGLGEYMDQPLRVYSDGMRVRLAFAVATQFEPEILLLDEIFGAGDQSFFDRATTRLLEIAGQSGITVFSTHWLELAERFCNRAIWLDHGAIVEDGPLEAVFEKYRSVRTQY
ncbi:MAG: ATP-binding cassette domain-containing protein [Henriciella sp.]